MMSLWEKISDICVSAMISEASVTPKPGLVDRNNCGSHDDMDYLLFLKSAMSLKSYFRDLSEYVMSSDTMPSLKDIRHFGLDAEKEMYLATECVNTHKGAIFSLGLFTVSFSLLLKKKNRTEPFLLLTELDELKENIISLTSGISDEKKSPDSRSGKLFGSKLKDARTEAEEGYPDIFETDFEALKKDCEKSGMDAALSRELIRLMSLTEDTNIASRGTVSSVDMVRKKSAELYSILRNTDDPEIIRNLIYDFDIYMIERHLSPGGSADKLILIIFLMMILRQI